MNSAMPDGTPAILRFGAWARALGGVLLLPGYDSSRATAVSRDGKVVLGWCQFNSSEVFIWDSDRGMRSLKSVLSNDHHLNLTGWNLYTAPGISADRKTIIGEGNHKGHIEAWVAHLDRPVNGPAGKGQSGPIPAKR
jgi:hypothetical protein